LFNWAAFLLLFKGTFHQNGDIAFTDLELTYTAIGFAFGAIVTFVQQWF